MRNEVAAFLSFDNV